MHRRTFIQTLAAAGAGMLVLPQLQARPYPAVKNIGLQLYTVRKAMGADPKGTLDQVAQTGYGLVEGAGYQEGLFYGFKPAEFKKILEDRGLRMPSGHTTTGQIMPKLKRTMMGGEWEAAVADFKEAGQEYVVLAFLAPPERKKIDDYKKVAELLNRCGEVCKKNGLQMAYHNHDFEFERLEEQLPMDVLLAETDPDLVKVELDIYWISKAGHDPLQFFEKYPGRCALWHVKDMDKTAARSFTEVGNGSIDWLRLFNAREKAGLKYFFVEQDQSKDPMASIKQSFNYLQGLKEMPKE